MQQVFVDRRLQFGATLTLADEQHHHLATVLRMADGQQIRVADAEGNFFVGFLCDGARSVNLTEALPPLARDDIVLGAALIKRDKWEWMLQKAAELGATTIVPLLTSRTVIQLDDRDQERKLQRWNAITAAAGAQCHSPRPCRVVAPSTLAQSMAYRQPCSLVAYENETGLTLSQALKPGPASVFIGPEGGWAESEIVFLRQQGFMACGLGPRILRAETAALYALAVIDALREAQP